MTTREMLAAIDAIVSKWPEYLDRPVKVMDYTGDRGGVPDDDEALAGILTTVETDCFHEDQGTVLLLIGGELVGRTPPTSTYPTTPET
jgi:hypothetical protein